VHYVRGVAFWFTRRADSLRVLLETFEIRTRVNPNVQHLLRHIASALNLVLLAYLAVHCGIELVHD
jgi:hypothetical protein